MVMYRKTKSQTSYSRKGVNLISIFFRYSSLLAEYPSVVVASVLILLVVCGASAFFGSKPPKLGNPGKVCND